MFHREYWHPKTTPASALATLGPRISATIRIGVYTLEPMPRLEAGGDSGRLREFRVDREAARQLTTEAAIFQHLAGVFERLSAAGWVEVEESLSYRAFLHGDAAAGKFWNVRLADRTLDVYFGKTAVKRRPLHCNSDTRTARAFATRDEAVAAYHEMIGEKLKKGYVELFPRATAPKKTTKRK